MIPGKYVAICNFLKLFLDSKKNILILYFLLHNHIDDMYSLERFKILTFIN